MLPGTTWQALSVRLTCSPRLRCARDRADRDFAQPLTFDDMARAAHPSKFHFARMFASTYGVTPHTYFGRRRIERGQGALARGEPHRAGDLLLVDESVGSFRTRSTIWLDAHIRVPRISGGNDGPPATPGCCIFMWTRPVSFSNPEVARASGRIACLHGHQPLAPGRVSCRAVQS